MEAVLEVKGIFGLSDEKAERAVSLFEELARKQAANGLSEKVEARVEKELAKEVRMLATKGDLQREIGSVREDLHAAREDLQREIGSVREGLQREISSVREDLQKEISSVREDLQKGMATLAVNMERMSANQTKWMASLIVAILLGVLALVATRPSGTSAPVAVEAR